MNSLIFIFSCNIVNELRDESVFCSAFASFAMKGLIFVYTAASKTTRTIFRLAGVLKVLSNSLTVGAFILVFRGKPFN